MANRFRHRQYQLKPDEWTEKFPTYWDSVPDLGFGNLKLDKDAWTKARSMIAGFLRARPAKLFDMPKEETRRGSAWPSPRTWDFASRQLAAILADGQHATEALPYVADCVGEGVATEFMAWCREIDLPDPWRLLKHPEQFQMPSRPDVAFAVMSAVAAAAVSDLTVKNWNAAWQILGTAAEKGGKDVAASAAKTLAEKYKPSLPRPSNELKHFIPVLRSAGLMRGSV